MRGGTSLARVFTFCGRSANRCRLPMDRSTWCLLLKSSSIWSAGRICWPRRGGCCGRRGCCWYRLRTEAYYAEARGAAGANPYHVHEFEAGEFESALKAVFPHVKVWTQNHSDVIVFNRAERSTGDFDALGDDRPEQAHFFLAACSQSPIRRFARFRVVACVGECSAGSRAACRAAGIRTGQEGRVAQADAERACGASESHEQLLTELARSNEWAEAAER